jgi:hypothetical protein
VYFLDRQSPETAAEEVWGSKPSPHELPALRSSSDLAWAFWERAATTTTIKNLKYFISCQIVNHDTSLLLERALQALDVDEVQGWPGTDLNLGFGPDKGDEIEAGLALLGTVYTLLHRNFD